MTSKNSIKHLLFVNLFAVVISLFLHHSLVRWYTYSFNLALPCQEVFLLTRPSQQVFILPLIPLMVQGCSNTSCHIILCRSLAILV